MAPKVSATAKVYWLTPERGGRKVPPSGSVYAATAQFDEQENEFFSIVIRFPTSKEQGENGTTSRVDEVEVGFLAPELVESKLTPGKEFSITEGNRIVAQCQIQSISSPVGNVSEA
ncbi:hypothetical protein [Scytonema millei]|uniref:Uncharacterized protein n=1 Tax=Scytonema millei VB511283 TaxID=1245923 RepID=A0A9X5I3R5_9CYAN|nr:hypothetical protein [Scytonema millei]NHC34245.1 hypothetical protein [Scytonema millei VB511283]